jgi:hypothetical protein
MQASIGLLEDSYIEVLLELKPCSKRAALVPRRCVVGIRNLTRSGLMETDFTPR